VAGLSISFQNPAQFVAVAFGHHHVSDDEIANGPNIISIDTVRVFRIVDNTRELLVLAIESIVMILQDAIDRVFQKAVLETEVFESDWLILSMQVWRGHEARAHRCDQVSPASHRSQSRGTRAIQN
jgi:hypothetical protein